MPLSVLLLNCMLALSRPTQPIVLVRHVVVCWLKGVGKLIGLQDFLLPAVSGIMQGDPHRTVPLQAHLYPYHGHLEEVCEHFINSIHFY